MAKDDFDKDFRFDDDDFDPKAFLDGEDGTDIDLSEFDDIPSGDKPKKTDSDGYDDDLDLSGLGLDEDPDETVDDLDLDDILSPKAVRRNAQEHDDFGSEKQSSDPDFDMTDFLDDEDEQAEDDSDFQDEPEDDYPDEEDEDKPARPQKEKPEKAPKPRRERKPKAPKEPKEAKPNIFTKLYDLYFAPLTNKEALEAPVDPANPRRRRRKTKAQIFKEVYLPPLIGCVCLILILLLLPLCFCLFLCSDCRHRFAEAPLRQVGVQAHPDSSPPHRSETVVHRPDRK